MKFVDLTKQRFGRLTVLGRVWRLNTDDKFWLCRCDCGNLKIIRNNNLISGRTKSCGCLNKEVASKRNSTHGMANSKIYETWCNIKKRCENSNNDNYHHYGGRGIVVCDDWQRFELFYEWAIKNGYQDDLEIDRIDVNGNYEPSNCRWITHKANCNNRRSNHLIEYDGRIHTLKEWSEILGISDRILRQRLCRDKWTIERALTTPSKRGLNERRKLLD